MSFSKSTNTYVVMDYRGQREYGSFPTLAEAKERSYDLASPASFRKKWTETGLMNGTTEYTNKDIDYKIVKLTLPPITMNITSTMNRTSGSSKRRHHRVRAHRRGRVLVRAHNRSHDVSILPFAFYRGEWVKERSTGDLGRIVARDRNNFGWRRYAVQFDTGKRIVEESALRRRPVAMEPRNHAGGTAVPKTFRKLATAPTRDGIDKQIARFYGGEFKQLVAVPDKPGWFAVKSGDKVLSTVVIETSRGFYFGVPS